MSADLFIKEMRDLADQLRGAGMSDAAREADEVVRIIEVSNDRIQMRYNRLFPLQDAIATGKRSELESAYTNYKSRAKEAGRG